jgi:hypothetical protein
MFPSVIREIRIFHFIQFKAFKIFHQKGYFFKRTGIPMKFVLRKVYAWVISIIEKVFNQIF